MKYYIINIALAFILSIMHFVMQKKKRKNFHRFLFILLSYMLSVGIGISSFIAFLGHAFKPDEIAAFIGWPAGSPFQFEVAIMNLSIAVLAFLCVFFKKEFWLATIISFSVTMLGCAYGHIHQINLTHNMSPGNAGIALYFDILMPVFIIIIYSTMLLTKTKES